MILVADERERLDASSRKSGWPQASTADHVSEADECGDYNDCSYVLLYRTNGYRNSLRGLSTRRSREIRAPRACDHEVKEAKALPALVNPLKYLYRVYIKVARVHFVLAFRAGHGSPRSMPLTSSCVPWPF